MEDITVKKQIEESLKESEGELRSIFNGVSDGIALLDSDGKIVKINKQLEDISNYSEEDILCKQIHELEIFSEKNIGQMLENFEAILSGEDVPPLELDATMKSGDRIYLEIQPTLIKTGDSVAGVVACIRDITMRKEFERALLESEDYLRTIFNSIEIGVAYLDKDGRVIKINQHLMDFSGYTEKDILDKQVNFLDMFTPDSLETMIIELEKLMSGEQVPPLEVEVFIKNSEKKQVVIQTNIVKKDDEVIGLIATLKDVSEQKHAEKAQKESEELYRLVSENTSDLIAICDLDGVYHYANPSHIQLGYKPEELIGISGMDLVHPEDLSEMLRLLEEALVDKIKSKDSRTIEFRTKGKDRDWHSLESTVNLIKDNDGNYTKLIFVSRDITERKKAREKILEERNRASLYLDILGHDVSNLNQTLISSCELMLSQEGLPEVHKKYAEMIFKQCIELVRLVDNVNRLSAMKEGEFEIRDVNLYKLLTNSFERIYQAYPERNISISHTLPESGLSVRSNYLLSDVFDNIIGNAVKYNNNDDINININHSHFDGGKYLKLEFKDNGPGIPDELKDQVFKRLERGEESVHGSGLGLTIAHEVVSRYGGQIWVEDRVKGKYKEGANFVMLLPKADANN